MGPFEAGGLIGRDHELAWLGERMEAAELGSGHGIAIVGEAGAGKSSVARVLADRASADGVTVRFGRCLQLEIERPFAGFLDALDTRSSTLLGPTLGVSRTVLEAGAIAATRFLLAERLIEAIEALANAVPVMVAVEDLHWADPSTLHLARLLGERGRDLSLLFVVTTRPPRLSSEVRRLLGSGALEVVELTPFDPAAVADLVRATVAREPGLRLTTALRGRAVTLC